MIDMINGGDGTLTVLLQEQGRVVLRAGDCVSLEQNERGQFTRAKVHGAKKARRRLVRQLRRGERRIARAIDKIDRDADARAQADAEFASACAWADAEIKP